MFWQFDGPARKQDETVGNATGPMSKTWVVYKHSKSEHILHCLPQKAKFEAIT